MGQAKGHAVKRNRPTAAAANRATTLAKVKAMPKAKLKLKLKRNFAKPKTSDKEKFQTGLG